MLHYVLVKDLQTGSSYYFLVEEWLSVDNEKTDGRVEMEVEASGKARQTLELLLMAAACLLMWSLPFFLQRRQHFCCCRAS